MNGSSGYVNYTVEELALDVTGFNGSSTTNFSFSRIADIDNVSNVTLENQFGKIRFLEPINATRLNFTEAVGIFSGGINVNIGRESRLNVSVEITSYNRSEVYPGIVKTLVGDCDECTIFSYVGGNLTFNSSGQSSFLGLSVFEFLELAPDITGFNGSSTTNFSFNTSIDIQNVSNVILENAFGKIEFLQPLNASQLNISQSINLSYNFISIAAGTEPRLNKFKKVTLYNISWTYPGIEDLGGACPESTCKITQYSNNNLSFTINFK